MVAKNSNNHEEEIFNLLENWEQSKVPDFFETRILSKVSSVKIEKVSKFNWAFLTTIILLNILVAYKAMNSTIEIKENQKESAYSEYLESDYYYTQYYNQ